MPPRCRCARLGWVWLVIAALSAVGCTVQVPDVQTTSSAPSAIGDRLTQVRTLLNQIPGAIQARDQSAFRTLLSNRDPTFADRARLIYTNLVAMPLEDLHFRAEPSTTSVSENRARLLGNDAWVQPVNVEWRVAGDDGPAEHRVWMSFVSGPTGVLLAGTIDGPSSPAVRQPLWWVGPVTAQRTGHVTVMVGAGQSAELWTTRAEAAVSAIRRLMPPGVARRWNGSVVFEIPATRRDFEAVLGATAGSRDQIAAVTQPEGSDGSEANRVVVNPRVLDLVDSGRLSTVLAHESVHVATSAAESPAPTWAEEGLAEWVSLRLGSHQQNWQTDELFTHVRAEGAPTTLPTDDAFSGEGGELGRAYAEAWLACRYIAETYSTTKLGQWYVELERGRSVDQATGDSLGISTTELTNRWRRYVEKLAE